MNQAPLFDDAGDRVEEVGSEPVTSVEEMLRIARAALAPEDDKTRAEPPYIAAKRRLRARTSGARYRGLVAKWAPHDTAKGYVAIHDPIECEWHEVSGADAPAWAKREAGLRARLYREGLRDAYDLTSRQIARFRRDKGLRRGDIGIVEEFPIEGEGAA